LPTITPHAMPYSTASQSICHPVHCSVTVETLAGLLSLRRLSVISSKTVFRFTKCPGLARHVVSVGLPCGIADGFGADVCGAEEIAHENWFSLRSQLDKGAFITTNVLSPSRVRNRR